MSTCLGKTTKGFPCKRKCHGKWCHYHQPKKSRQSSPRQSSPRQSSPRQSFKSKGQVVIGGHPKPDFDGHLKDPAVIGALKQYVNAEQQIAEYKRAHKFMHGERSHPLLSKTEEKEGYLDLTRKSGRALRELLATRQVSMERHHTRPIDTLMYDVNYLSDPT